jgi:hypothetical protein
MPDKQFVILPRKGARRDDADAKLVTVLVKALVPMPVAENITKTQESNLEKIAQGTGGQIYIHIDHFNTAYQQQKQGRAGGFTINFKDVKNQCLHGDGRTTPVLRTRREVTDAAAAPRSARKASSDARTSELDETKRKLAAAIDNNKRLKKEMASMKAPPPPVPATASFLTPGFLTDDNVTTLTGMPSVRALQAFYGWVNCNGFWDQVRWYEPTADSTVDPSITGSVPVSSAAPSSAPSSAAPPS